MPKLEILLDHVHVFEKLTRVPYITDPLAYDWLTKSIVQTPFLVDARALATTEGNGWVINVYLLKGGIGTVQRVRIVQ